MNAINKIVKSKIIHDSLKSKLKNKREDQLEISEQDLSQVITVAMPQDHISLNENKIIGSKKYKETEEDASFSSTEDLRDADTVGISTSASSQTGAPQHTATFGTPVASPSNTVSPSDNEQKPLVDNLDLGFEEDRREDLPYIAETPTSTFPLWGAALALGAVGIAAAALAKPSTPEATNTAPVLSLSQPIQLTAGDAKAGVVMAHASATDKENDSLTFSLTSNDGNYYAIDSVTGVVTLTAAGAALVNSGKDLPLIHVTVADNNAAGPQSSSDTAIVPPTTVTIPNANADTASTSQGNSVSGSVATNDSDTDPSSKLSYALTNSVPGLTFNADGSYKFDAVSANLASLPAGVSTTVQAQYIVTDSHGATNTATLSIVVTGTNDPATVSADSKSVTEGTTASALSTSGTVVITDIDTGEAHSAVQTNTAGHYGNFSINANGAWTYTASSAHNELAAGQVVVDSFTVTSLDGSATNTVTITLTGTNNAPIITNSLSSGSVKEDSVATATGTLTASDVDTGDHQHWSLQGTPDTTYGTMALNSSTGVWTYTLDNTKAATQALAQGETKTLTYTARVADDAGAFVDQTVTITVTGSDDKPVVTNAASALTGAVVEAGNHPDNSVVAGTPSASGTLTASDVDTGDHQHWSLQGTPDTTYGTMALDSTTGVWTYTLDNTKAATQALAQGETKTLTYTARVADDAGAFVDQTITVVVTGTDDTPAATSPASALVGSVIEAGQHPDNSALAGTPSASGTLTASDVDSASTQSWSLQGTPDTTYGAMVLDATTGVWTYTLDNTKAATQALAQGETKTLTYTARMADNSGAFVDQTVTITVTGSDDMPVVTNAASALTGAVVEAGNHPDNSVVAGTPSASGTLTASDVDTGDHQHWSLQGTPDTTYGTMALDSTTGVWTYTLDNTKAATQALAQGETKTLTYTARVADDAGAFVDQTITVVVTGTDDTPAATSPASALVGSVIEAGQHPDNSALAGTPSASGTLTASDVDSASTQSWSLQGTPDTTYGAMVLDATTGVWTYTLDNTKAATQALAQGETKTLTYTARMADNSGAFVDQTVTITVTGSDDMPVVTNAASALTGAVVEAGNHPDNSVVAGTPSASGTLTASDVDTGDHQHWSLQGTPDTTYGTMALDSTTGVWTYTLDNTKAATQALAQGETKTLTYTARVADDAGAFVDQTITVVVTGTDDTPAATSPASALVGSVIEAGQHPDNSALAGTPSASGTLTASDVDSASTQSWSLQGTPDTTYGAMVLDATTGVWTYTLDNTKAATQALALGETKTLTYTARATDNSGAFVDQTVTITVTGSDDMPVATSAASALAGAVVESGNHPDNSIMAGTPSATGTLTASDVDTGDHQHWTLQGTPDTTYGTMMLNSSTGVWTYTLDNTLAATQALAQGETKTLTYTARVADDAGAFVDQTVTVVVTGTDDTPVASSPASALVGSVIEAGQHPDNSALAGTPSATGTLTVSDVDSASTQTWALQGTPDTTYGAMVLNSSTGVWTYTLDNTKAATQALAQGETKTLTYTARMADNAGAFVDQTVTITVTGSDDMPVVTNAASALKGAVVEAGNHPDNSIMAGTPSATGTLTATDVDTGDHQHWSLQGAPDTTYGTMALDSTTGVWTYTLDNTKAATQALAQGETKTLTYTARVADDAGAFVDQTVTVTLTGTNDIPVVTNSTAALVGAVAESGVASDGITAAPGTPSATGTLAASDVDAGDHQHWVLQGTPDSTYGSMVLDAATGAWTYTLDNTLPATQALNVGETKTLTYVARVTDDAGAFVDQTVTITVNGTNDVPVITNASTALVGGVVESGVSGNGSSAVLGTASATGTLTASDVDAGDHQHWALQGTPDTTYGAMALDATTGVWTYNLDNTLAATQALNVGETKTVNYTARVTDDHGAFVDQTVAITVTGTNDIPVITNTSAALLGTVTEDTTAIATGVLGATDVDLGDHQTWSLQGTPDTTYGTMNLDTSGKWTYTLDNTLTATQALNSGDSKTLNFTARVTDLHGAFVDQTIAVTVNGTDDAPINTVPNTSGLVGSGTNEPLSTLHNTPKPIVGLAVSDVDSGVTAPMSVTLSVLHGTLHIASSSGIALSPATDAASVTLTGFLADINTALAASNGVVYTPSTNYSGPDTLTMLTKDNPNSPASSLSDTDTVAINVVDNSESSITMLITTDVDNNGVITNTEINGLATVAAKVTFTTPADVSVGDVLTIADTLGHTQLFTLTASNITNGVTTTFAKPNEGASIILTATLADAAGNTTTATDSALLNTLPPGTPFVQIVADTNNDGIINAAEYAPTTAIRVNFPPAPGALDTYRLTQAGDVVELFAADKVTSLGSHIITSTDITNGYYDFINIAVPTSGTLQVLGRLSDSVSGYSDPGWVANTPGSDIATIDSAIPTIAITRAGTGNLLNGASDTVTFTLSKDATDFTASDVTVSSGANLSNFSGSGKVYTATLTVGTSNAVISVGNNAFHDASGNANTDGADANNTLTIVAANDAPVNTAPSAQSTHEDASLAITGLAIADVDAGTASMTVTLTVLHGVLTVSGGSAIISGSGSGSVTLTGSVADINSTLSASNAVHYAPTANFNGSDTLNMLTSDNGNTGAGGTLTASSSVGITVNSVNDAPTSADKTLTTGEGTALTLATSDFAFSDTNDIPSNALLGVKVTTLASAGTLFLDANGNGIVDAGEAVVAAQTIVKADLDAGKLKFIPGAHANGTNYSNFTFQVQDDGGIANGGTDLSVTPNTIKFNVTSVNDAPTAANKTLTAAEDTALTIATADFGFADTNDTPSNALLNVKIGTTVSAGTLFLDANNNGIADAGETVAAGQTISKIDLDAGKLKFIAAANASGTSYSNFTFQVQDDGGTASGGVDTSTTPNTISLNVTPVNDAPTAANKTLTTNEDTALTIATADFGFADASDTPNNALLNVKIGTTASAGTLFLDANSNGIADAGETVAAGQTISKIDLDAGKLKFIAAANASGTNYSNFTFQVQDNGGTASGGVDTSTTPNTISLNVTPVNDAPTAANKTLAAVEDTALTIATSDFGFADASDTPSNALLNVKIDTTASAGTLFLDANGNGVADLGEAVSSGQFISKADLDAGKLKFIAAANANGTNYSNITFQVQDDGGTLNTGVDTSTTPNTIKFDVSAVNDAPVNTVPNTSGAIGSGTNEPLSTTQNTALPVTGLAISDVDAGTGLMTVTLGVAHGTLHVVAGTGVTLTTANDLATVSLSGTVAAINATLAASSGVVYNPANYYYGADTLTLTTNDNGNTGSGGSLSDTDTVAINVKDTTESPIVLSITTDSNNNGIITATELNSASKVTTLITFSNQPDVSPGDVLQVVDNHGNTQLFTLTASDISNGVTALIDKPAEGATLFVTATLSDAAGNTATSNDSALLNTLPPGTPFVQILADTNNDGTINTAEYTATVTHTTSVRLTLPPTPLPTDTYAAPVAGNIINLYASDKTTVIGTHTLTAGDIALGYYDFTNIALPPSGTLTVVGQLINTTNNNAADPGWVAGTPTTDSALMDIATPAISIARSGTGDLLNGASDTVTFTLSKPSTDFTASDVTVSSGAILSNFTGSGTSYTATLTVGSSNAVISVASNAFHDSKGNANADGADADNTLTILAANDAPVNTVPSAQTALEDTSLAITGLAITDVDAGTGIETVTLSVASGTLTVAGGTATITGSGTSSVTLTGTTTAINSTLSATNGVAYKGNANYVGNDTLTMTTSDGGNTGSGGTKTDTDTVAITVMNVNDAPAGTNNTLTAIEDTALTITKANFGFTDPLDTPANNMTGVKITTLTSAGSLFLDANNNGIVDTGEAVAAGSVVTVAALDAGQLKFLAAANGNGTPYSTFTFQVQDDGGTANGGVNTDASPNTMTLNVTAVNDAPVNTVPGAQSALEDTNLVITGLSITDVDAGAGTETVTLSVASGTLTVAGGTATIAGSGTGSVTLTGTVAAINSTLSAASSVTYKGNANYVGSDTLTMTTNDGGNTGTGGALTDVDTIAITIANVNDAPAGTNKTLTATEDTVLTIAKADFGFTDPLDTPANNMTGVKITTLTSAGSLFIDANNNGIVDAGEAVTAGSIVSAATLDANQLKFLAATNANGSPYSTFTFQVQDDGGTANGGVNTDASPNTMTLNVTPVNDPPVLSTVPANLAVDQSFKAGNAFTYTLPAAEFSDVDIATNGDVITRSYTATDQLGNPVDLSAWLTFNATTGTFSATAAAPVVPGSYLISVIATDTAGATSAADIFTLSPIGVQLTGVQTDTGWQLASTASSYTDMVTSNNTPTIYGTGTPGGYVDVTGTVQYLNAGTVTSVTLGTVMDPANPTVPINRAIVKPDGTWSMILQMVDPNDATQTIPIPLLDQVAYNNPTTVGSAQAYQYTNLTPATGYALTAKWTDIIGDARVVDSSPAITASTTAKNLVIDTVAPDLGVVGMSGSEQVVNSTTTNYQWMSRIAALADGGYEVVWLQSAVNGSPYYMAAMGQRYDKDGNKVGNETLLTSIPLTSYMTEGYFWGANGGNIPNLDVVGNVDDAGFTVTWNNPYAHAWNVASGAITSRSFDANGVAITAADVAVTPGGAYDSNHLPHLAEIKSGAFKGLVLDVWDSTVSTYNDVKLQAVNSVTGAKAGAALTVESGSAYNATTKTGGYVGHLADGGTAMDGVGITALNDGTFVVVYQKGGTSATMQTYAEHYSVGGTMAAPTYTQIGTTAQITAAGKQAMPQVASLAGGGYVVVWDNYTTTGGDVTAQRFNADGTKIDATPITVNTTTAGYQGQLTSSDVSQNYQVTGLANGGYVVVWGAADASGSGVYMTIFDASGHKVAYNNQTDIPVNGFTAGTQMLPDVAALNDGGFAVTWSSYGQDKSAWTVVKKVYEADGSVRTQATTPTDIQLSSLDKLAATTSQNGLELSNMGTDGKYAAVWVENTSATPGFNTGNYYSIVRLAVIDGTNTDVKDLIMPTAAATATTAGSAAAYWNSTTTTTTTLAAYSNIGQSDGAKYSPSIDVIRLADGGYVVAAEVQKPAATTGTNIMNGGRNIMLQVFNSDGTTRTSVLDGTGGTGAADNDGKPILLELKNADGSASGNFTMVYSGEAAGAATGTSTPTFGIYNDTTGATVVSRQVVVANASTSVGKGYDGTGGQETDAVALAKGGFVVTWSDNSTVNTAASGGLPAVAGVTDTTGYRVLMQTYNNSGVAVGSTTQVNTTTANDQRSPTIASLSDGGYVISWVGDSTATTNWNLYEQRYDATGAKVGGEIMIAGKTTGTAADGVVAPATGTVTAPGQDANTCTMGLSNGGWAVAYTQTDPTDTAHVNMFVNVYDAAGNIVRNNVLVNSKLANDQFWPTLSANLAGGFTVGWTSSDKTGGNVNYVKSFDASGQQMPYGTLTPAAGLTDIIVESNLLIGGSTNSLANDVAQAAMDSTYIPLASNQDTHLFRADVSHNGKFAGETLTWDAAKATAAGLTVTYDSASQTLTAIRPVGDTTGATLDQMEAFLRSVGFHAPTAAGAQSVDINYTIYDHAGATTAVTSGIQVLGLNGYSEAATGAFTGTAHDDTISITSSAVTLVNAGDGNDDILLPSTVYASGVPTMTIDGGAGFDELTLGIKGAATLLLSDLATKVTNVEELNLSSGTANPVTLTISSAANVMSILGGNLTTSDHLLINGDISDNIHLATASGYTRTGGVNVDGVSYSVFDTGVATNPKLWLADQTVLTMV